MIKRAIDQLRSWAKRLKSEVYTLYMAVRDARTPVMVRYFALFIVGYALSPIDLIPDFIPVLGLLDDLVLLPLGIALLRRMIPDVVLVTARRQAERLARSGLPASQTAAMLIMAIWALVLSAGIWWIANRIVSPPEPVYEQTPPASSVSAPETPTTKAKKRDRSRDRQ